VPAEIFPLAGSQAYRSAWQFVSLAHAATHRGCRIPTGFEAHCPYSHSIINEPSKRLIGKAPDAASQISTVILAVNLTGTSNGAGFRPVRPTLTFRDLSRSIDSDDGCQRNRRASVLVG
jgi:hypothetical protein